MEEMVRKHSEVGQTRVGVGRQGTEIDIESVAVHDIVLYLISCSPPSQANPILVHL